MKKRGVFFSIDAIIAFSIILLTIIAVSVSVSHSKKETQIPGDLIKSLSVLKAGEIDNLYFKQLLADGIITDSNKSVLEQIGEFYVTNISRAREAAESIFEDLNISDNIGIWYGDELIASKNKTSFENAKNIKVERQVISGLQEGGSVTGFSSRAYLESELKSKYFYFGGYVGDGNLSMIINYTGDIEKVILEITSNQDFIIYINGEFCGVYENSEDYFTPAFYDLDAYKSNFTSGENKITLQGNTSSLFVAGGYLKIEYKNSTDFYNQLNHYYFPGIEGLINLYDGFYIPGELNEMEIFLHYHSNYSIFLNIGNTTVYNGSDENEMSVTITNSELSGLLDYSEIVNKTIPLRLGMDNVSYISTIRKYVDVYSVTDLSGSMDYCSELYQCNYTCTIGGFRSCLTLRPCSDRPCGGWGCGGYSGSCPAGLTLLELAKDANKEFIDVILENEGNKVGLVGYEILFPRYFSEYKKPKDTADLKKDIAIIAGKILDLSKKL